MKNRLFYVGAMIMAVCACSKEVNTNINVNIPTESLNVHISGTQTKSSLGEDGKSVLWTEGDAVSVLSNVEGAGAVDMPLSNINGTSAEISGEVAAGTSGLMMVYPTTVMSSYSFDAGNPSVTVSLPAEQSPVAGTFAENANIAVAYAEKSPGVPEVDDVTFNNVCGLIKFTVPSNIANIKKVVFTNSGTAALAGQYSVNPVTMSGNTVGGGSTSISMSGDFASGSRFCFLALPAEVNGFTITMETATKSYTMVSESSFAVKSGSNFNLGELQFKEAPKVTYAHVNRDSDGKFAGTEITLSNARISDKTTNVTIKNAAGEVYRELTYNAVDNITFDVTGDKPYLPAGSYTAEFKYAVGGKSYGLVSSSFYVDAPGASRFTLTLGEPVTSYSKYLAGDIAGANAWTNDKVGNLTATVNISDAVLAQMGTACEFLVDGESKDSQSVFTNGTYAANNIESLPMAEHKLTAKINFDGVEINSVEKAFVITGLPHDCAMTANEFKLSSKTYCKFIDGHIQLGKSASVTDCKATSIIPFYVPQNINVRTTTNVKVYAYRFAVWYNTEFFVKVAGTESGERVKSNNNTNGVEANVESNGMFSPDNKTIELISVSPKSNSGSDVYSCKIEYR